nr:helix-turn-helix domain-containing protein [Propionibacterium sp.]
MATKATTKAGSAYTDQELNELLATYGKFVSYPVAAELTGASERTLKRLTARGDLPCYTVGRTRTYRLKTTDVVGLMRQVA